MRAPSRDLLHYLRNALSASTSKNRCNASTGGRRHARGIPAYGVPRKHVVLGMSGGVDSSVSAHLLLQQGYHVTGVFMRNWDERDERGVCPSEDDWRDVQRVCKQLNISCQRVDFCKEYWINVFDHFITDLARGHTPNPDIACNQAIKFGAFFDRFAAGNEGADYIATGHYARVQRQNDGSVHLVRAVDPVKDQTYYLSTVPEASLTRTLFPIGGYHKSDIKRIARDNGLEAIADRRESMGICFIGKRDFGDFVDEYIAPKPGSIVSLDGQRKGHHHGMTRFTIGQRARISGETERWYVVEKDMASNTIYVAPGPTHPALFRSEVVVNDWTWINSGRQNFSELEDDGYIDITVKHRYRMEPVPGRIYRDPKTPTSYVFRFRDPQAGLALGQYVVAYLGERCLGGGSISVLGQWAYDGVLPTVSLDPSF